MHLLYAVESCQKIQPHRVTGIMSSRGSPAPGGSSSPRGRGSPNANVFERARLTHNLPNDTEEVLRVWVSDCPGRRSLPMAIQDNLRMLLVMGDECLACHTEDLKDAQCALTDPDMELRLKSEHDRFHSSLKAMSRDEIASALLVDSSKLALNQVPCTSCRKRVNDILALVITSHPVALHPLVFSKQGANSERQSDFVSVDTHHVALPEALANLFTRRFYFLWQRFEEVHLATRSIRCHLHTRPMKPQPFCSSWLDAWRAMAPDCQAKMCSIPFSEVELRLDEFLNRHNFCSECKATVKLACALLLEKKKTPVSISDTSVANTDDIVDEKEDYCPETYANLIVGRPTWLTASTEDTPEDDDALYVRVDLNPDEIGRMLETAHLDMYGHKVERHAKTIAVGQREVLSCIGTILYQRFYDASKLVQDYFNNFEALYVLSLKLLKESLEQHFENKFGLKEATLLNELNAEEERNKARAVKKREKKQRQRERQRQVQQAKDERDHDEEDGQDEDKKSDITSIATTTTTTTTDDGTASPDSCASIQEQLDEDPEEAQTPEQTQSQAVTPAVPPVATPTPSKKAAKHAKKNQHTKKSKAPPETKPEPPPPSVPVPVPESHKTAEECVPCKLVLRREQPPIPDLFSIIDVWNQSKEVNTMKYMDPKDPRSRGETHSDESEVDENEPEPDPAGEPYIPESEIQSYLDNKKRIDEQRLAIRKKLTMNFNRKFGRNLIIENGVISTNPARSDDL